MPIVLKSGNLNLLEPSGPVQACNGIALPLSSVVTCYRGGLTVCADCRTFFLLSFLSVELLILKWFGEWSVARRYEGVTGFGLSIPSASTWTKVTPLGRKVKNKRTVLQKAVAWATPAGRSESYCCLNFNICVVFSAVCQGGAADSQQTIRTAVTVMGSWSLTWQELRVSASGGQVHCTGHNAFMVQRVQGRSICYSYCKPACLPVRITA